MWLWRKNNSNFVKVCWLLLGLSLEENGYRMATANIAWISSDRLHHFQRPRYGL
jgi:hypothetical protein